MVSSAMEFQLGVFVVLPTTHVEKNANKMRPWSLCGVSCMFSSCLDNTTYAPDKSHLLWLQEKPKYPQLEPHARDKDGAGSGISGVYLWAFHRNPYFSQWKCLNTSIIWFLLNYSIKLYFHKLSLALFFMWCWLLLCLNPLRQNVCLYGLSLKFVWNYLINFFSINLVWQRFSCDRWLLLCVNPLQQNVHLYGLSPVCRLSCAFREEFWVKRASQYEHWNGWLSTVCVSLCRFKFRLDEKTFPHVEHSVFAGSVWHFACRRT